MNIRNRILIISLISLLIILLASACGAISINLTLDANGGVFEGGSSTSVINTDGTSTVTIPNNPTKDGYTFGGWFWDKDVWEQPFTANSLLDAPIRSDMTVYAKWILDDNEEEPITYTVSFNTNGGSEIADIIIEAGTTITMPADPTKDSFVFEAWYYDNDVYDEEALSDHLEPPPHHFAGDYDSAPVYFHAASLYRQLFGCHFLYYAGPELHYCHLDCLQARQPHL